MKLFDIEALSPDDHIYKIITRTNSFYERDLLDYMRLLLRHTNRLNTIAIDVGANIGNHAIFFQTFLADYLIAIEPNPKILPLLRRNLSQNINNYSIYECAVGESDGTGMIVMPKDAPDKTGMAKVVIDYNNGTIPITTIDSIVNKWEADNNYYCTISIIKIDVEGMELAVLKGAEKAILKHKPHIFVEAATTQEFCSLNNYLQSLGYRKLSRWAATPVYHFAFKPAFTTILNAHRAYVLLNIRHLGNRLARRFS